MDCAHLVSSPPLFCRYVGGVNFTPAHSGRNNVALTQSQYISIEVGDILGLSWRSGGVIDFDTTGCQHRPNTRCRLQMSSHLDVVITLRCTNTLD